MNLTRALSSALVCVAVLSPATSRSATPQFATTNLVSDDMAAHGAQIVDPGLLNAWGISYGPTGPFWVSSNGGGTSTVYRVDPVTQATSKVALTVSIPGAGNVTGQVFNAGGAGQFNGNAFLFVSEDGNVSGWRGALGSSAETLSSLSAIYKGAAYGSVGGNGYLYAADFHGGTVNVFKGNAGAPILPGTFSDPTMASGYAPFNVQTLGGSVYVTYAKQDPSSPDEVAGAGLGYVNRFDMQGNFMGRVASGGVLNAPWGLAIAPSSFGDLSGALLVGNFGDGRISAYDRTTNALLGQLQGANGQPLSIDGLWALNVGNDALAGSSHAVYFTAGPDDESHGVFGVIQAVPEPHGLSLLVVGLMVIAGRRIGLGRSSFRR